MAPSLIRYQGRYNLNAYSTVSPISLDLAPDSPLPLPCPSGGPVLTITRDGAQLSLASWPIGLRSRLHPHGVYAYSQLDQAGGSVFHRVSQMNEATFVCPIPTLSLSPLVLSTTFSNLFTYDALFTLDSPPPDPGSKSIGPFGSCHNNDLVLIFPLEKQKARYLWTNVGPLVAASPYFRTMFNSGMQESERTLPNATTVIETISRDLAQIVSEHWKKRGKAGQK